VGRAEHCRRLVLQSVARTVYAGAQTREQAEAALESIGMPMSRLSSAGYWRKYGGLSGVEPAQQAAAMLSQAGGRLERYLAQVEGVTNSIAERLRAEGTGEKELVGLTQRYTELVRCLWDMAKQILEEERSEASRADALTLAEILDDERVEPGAEAALYNTVRQAAAACGALLEAPGAA